jgi:Arc/MetJ-type ribon-helix-helix transcriptional regulator
VPAGKALGSSGRAGRGRRLVIAGRTEGDPRGMMKYHTGEAMAKTKLAVTLEASLVGELDQLVSRRHFANRSQAIEVAVVEKLARIARTRLAKECSKLDQEEERAIAEEGLAGSRETWPEY